MHIMSTEEQLEILPSPNGHCMNLTSVGNTGVIGYAVLLASGNCSTHWNVRSRNTETTLFPICNCGVCR